MKRMWILFTFLAAIILGMTALAIVVSAELRAMTAEPAAADAIVVLGARVRPDRSLSLTLQYRLHKALSLYEQGYAKHIIVCGGQGDDEPYPEADAMGEYLMEHGVPESVIVREAQSSNTNENLRFAKELMDARGLYTALVVTSDYHLVRALHLAGDAGISASGAGSATPEISYLWFMRVREILGWAKHFVLE